MGEPGSPFYSPDNTFVLIVYCMVDPLDEERRTIGDVGLLRAFQELVPESNLVYLSDSETTKITSTETFQSLERLLQSIPERDGPPCQVVIYYGGHGKEEGFCMDDGLCRHRDLVELMETHLREGDACWILADCCYSGNFCDSLQCREGLKGSYCCLMSTTHDEEAAGDEWCLPGAFVAVMTGRIPPQYNDSDNHDNDAVEERDANWVPTTDQAVSYMADQHALINMDRMTAWICGSSIRPNAPFPFMIGDKDSALSLDESLASVLDSFVRCGSSTDESLVPQVSTQDLAVGDKVYAKWRGGKPTNESMYLMPTWYPAKVTVIPESNEASLHLKFEYSFPHMTWESNADISDVTDQLTFNYRYYDDTPPGIQRAQCQMAKCGKYLIYSIPVGTRVWGLWDDDEVLYEGTVMSDRDLPWRELGKNHFEEKYPGIVGPYIIVEWNEEENWTIVPLCHLFVQKNPSDAVPTVAEIRDRARIAVEQLSMLSHTPMECLIRSFCSAGKILKPSEEVFGSNRLTCFCAEGCDSDWYDAKSGELRKDDVNALTSHLYYEESGEYCIVRWEEDGSQSCLPKKFIRRR